MAINIYEDTKVYIVSPAYAFTGGPELLHQLSYCMRKELDYENVFMVYYSQKDEYKFEGKDEEIPMIADKIRECISGYKEKIKDFEHYRNIIRNEKEKFKKDIREIFVKVN